MRALIVIFLLILAALAGSPFFVGSKVESNFREQLSRWDDLPVYRVEVESYDRGYLSSQALIVVGLEEEILQNLGQDLEQEAELSNALEGISLFLDVQHGPVLTEHGFGLGWTDLSFSFDRETYPQFTEVFDTLEQDNLFEWALRVGLDGSGWFESEIPDIDASIEKGSANAQILVQGYENRSTFTDFGQSVAGEAILEELSFELDGDEVASASLKDMRAEGEFSLTDSLWIGIGSGEVLLGSMEFVSDELSFSARDASVHAQMSAGTVPETLSLRESLRIAEIDANGYNVKNAEIAFAYKNISKALLEAYMEMSNSALATPSSETFQAEMREKLEPLLNDALRYNPGIEIESIAFQSDDGELSGSASLEINSEKLSGNVNFNAPLMLLPALVALADIEISESLVRKLMILQTQSRFSELPAEDQPELSQIEQMVDTQIALFSGQFEQQGYIEREGDKFISSFSFADGVVVLNGTAIDLPFF